MQLAEELAASERARRAAEAERDELNEEIMNTSTKVKHESILTVVFAVETFFFKYLRIFRALLWPMRRNAWKLGSPLWKKI